MKASYEAYLEGKGLWGKDYYLSEIMSNIYHYVESDQLDNIEAVDRILARAKKVRITIEELENEQ